MASSSKRPGMAVMKSVLTPVMTLEGHESIFYITDNGHRGEIKSVEYISYFPDGKQMISGTWDKTIRRWDLREGKEIKEAREVGERDIRAVGVSRDGRWVVTAVRGVLKVSEVETGIVRTFHDGFSTWIECIDISADSMLVVVGSMDSQVRIWSLDTGKLVAGPFKISYGDDRECPGALRFSEDSKKLAVMSLWGKWLQVWDVQAQKLDPVTTEEFLTPDDFSPTRSPPVFWTTKDKSIIAAPSFTLDFGIRDPRIVYEFDASTLQTVGDPFEGHADFITGLALSSDCVLLASASHDTINLWSFESRQLLASFEAHGCRSLILSPDSCQLAYTTWNESNIYVCDIPVNILASIGLVKQVCIHPVMHHSGVEISCRQANLSLHTSLSCSMYVILFF
jgi:WD40 repeat protein